jgi:hypothetical protein
MLAGERANGEFALAVGFKVAGADETLVCEG